MILTVGNTKGGTGKSTIAVNLAIHRARQHSVLLVDGDEQQSAIAFTQLRNREDYTAIALTGSLIRSKVPRLSKHHETVIIDVGGRDTGSFRAALTISDILIIPIQPRTFDVLAMESVVKLVEEARTFNHKLKAIPILNLAEVHGKENESACDNIIQYRELFSHYSPGDLMKIMIIMRRKVYSESIARGLGMIEMRPVNKKAILEFELLVQHLWSQ